MAKKKVLVLQHDPREGLGVFAALLAEKRAEIKVVNLYKGEAPPDPSLFSALIVMGGPASAWEEEEYPYLREEDRAIKRAVEKGVPYLGVCLGAQLLAKALGARVFRNEVKEIGFFPIALTEAGARDRLFRGWPRQPTVFHWHEDTFDIPSGAVRLASSPLCPNQAFRFQDRFYALQFHVEVTPEMVTDWAGPEEKGMVKEALRRQEEIKGLCFRLFANFWELVQERREDDRQW